MRQRLDKVIPPSETNGSPTVDSTWAEGGEPAVLARAALRQSLSSAAAEEHELLPTRAGSGKGVKHPARQPRRSPLRTNARGATPGAAPLHPGVPDGEEHDQVLPRSNELSLMRTASSLDVPWAERHAPLQTQAIFRTLARKPRSGPGSGSGSGSE